MRRDEMQIEKIGEERRAEERAEERRDMTCESDQGCV